MSHGSHRHRPSKPRKPWPRWVKFILNGVMFWLLVALAVNLYAIYRYEIW